MYNCKLKRTKEILQKIETQFGSVEKYPTINRYESKKIFK